MSMTFKHWRIERDTDDVAWLIFDRAGQSTNTFSIEVLNELSQALDELNSAPPRALIIRSGKESGFIAGADIEEFTKIDSVEGARKMVQAGWDAFNKLEATPYPTVALIRGFCMGGGLELALACTYRVVVDEPATRLALPEVMLGIVPGWGAMLRLPQRIGAPAALDMLLTGRSADARKARKLGLADECVPPRIMMNTAKMLALAAPPGRHPGFWLSLTDGPLKGFVASSAKKTVAKKAKPDQYPAPYAILDIWQNYGGNALLVPDDSPSSLASIFRGETARNLIRIFFLQERLKNLGKESDFAPRHVHVIGAGVMGGDIAAWCALRGMTATLQDQNAERLAPAMKRAEQLFKRRLKNDKARLRDARDRLIPDVSGSGAAQADVVIEAIFENLDAKRALFAGLEKKMKPDAIMATNTSSLRLEDIAANLANPPRLIGLHFFNPVPQMPLVEIVHTPHTDREAIKRGAAFARKIDKLPLPVKSSPGFLVNRVLGPYMNAAIRMVDEGADAETIDAAAEKFGMPMGPIELADTVGLDICLAAGKALAGAGVEPPKNLLDLIAAGNLGKKTGRGFYAWDNGKPVKGAAGQVTDALISRLLAPYLKEAQACLAEGIAGDAELTDAGLIFGTGFAPFRGGPINYLKTHPLQS
jgi:3-hydroxyacyl-CoA dehydrogenase/enoyl-CoA hydratase/3-hydroxybutyryl-CoA epimerase